MPHNASEYVVANVLPKIGVASPTLYTINYIDAAFIEQILHEDAKDHLYSGIISFANACASIRVGYYSWSTVKLYYAIFYMIRGLLANAGTCICYMSNKPMILTRIPQMKPQLCSPCGSSGLKFSRLQVIERGGNGGPDG